MGKTVTSRFVLKGDNQLNSSFSKARRQMAKLGKQAAVVSVAIGAVFARNVIKNTIEQEKAVAQLNVALQSTGRFTPEASKALLDHAAALQQVSTYGDEAVIKAQAMLLTFRNIGGEAFPRATQAVLDTATAMGTDLKSAAIQVGKALNDPKTQLTALSRSGITFSDTQKQMIFDMVDAGDTAGAQAAILKELEIQFGGSAKAARDTFGGALDAVKNNFGDLLEVTTGENGAVSAMNDMSELLARPETKEGFQKLAQGVFEFLSFLVQVPQALVEIKEDLNLLFGAETERNIRQQKELLADYEARLQALFDSPNQDSGTQAAIRENSILLAQEREVLAVMEAQNSERKAAQTIVLPGQLVAQNVPAAPPEPDTQNDSVRETFELYDTSLIPAMREYTMVVKEAGEQFGEMNEFAVQAARNIQTQFADFLFDPFDQGLKGMLKGFATTIRRMVAEAASAQILKAIFGGMGGGGGFFGNLFSSLAGKADGGPVAAGVPYLVGERGPEIIVPRGAGTVIPNNQMGGNNITVHIDARQADDPAAILALTPVIASQIEQSLMLKMRRGMM